MALKHETLAGFAASLLRGAAVAGLVSATPALADQPADAESDAVIALEVEHAVTRILSIDGDPAFGEYLGGECVTCHQQSGEGSSIPPIRGLPADYTVQALVEYKLGARDNNVMKLMTARLGDEEIAALAAYFAGFDVD